MVCRMSLWKSLQARTKKLHREPLTISYMNHIDIRAKRNRGSFAQRIRALPPRTCLVVVCIIHALLLFLTVGLLYEAFTEKRVTDQGLIENRSNNGSHKLHIFRYNGVDDLNKMIEDYWGRHEIFCPVAERRLTTKIPDLPVTVEITFNCEELFNFPSWGTASFINLFYGLRLTAIADGNIHLYLECDDADDKKLELIHPWLMGYFPPPKKVENSPTNDLKSWPFSCVDNFHSLAYAYDLIQYDLRRMAIALVGMTDHISKHDKEQFWSKPPSNTLQSAYTLPTPTKDDTPFLASSDISLDDAVIHFRCGDLMNSTHPLYSLLSFYDYTRFISKEAKSIGILTQSFECEKNRLLDSHHGLCERCRILIMSLVDFIQKKHPDAKVSIHNNDQETTALTYARMIMANQTIVGVSGFSAFGALATFGTSYIPIPKHYTANFVVNFMPSTLLPKNVLRYSDANVIMVADFKALWESENGTERVLEWFRNDTRDSSVPPVWINDDDDGFAVYEWCMAGLALVMTITICFVLRRHLRLYHALMLLAFFVCTSVFADI